MIVKNTEDTKQGINSFLFFWGAEFFNCIQHGCASAGRVVCLRCSQSLVGLRKNIHAVNHLYVLNQHGKLPLLTGW